MRPCVLHPATGRSDPRSVPVPGLDGSTQRRQTFGLPLQPGARAAPEHPFQRQGDLLGEAGGA